jgi:asparagine synthase (glutamine-hydrolysing)
MCGIAGFLGLSDVQLLRRMSEILSHRGPDDSGEFLDDDVGLANRRLSIIDIQGSHQPVHNEDEAIWVVFNGEVYNYRQLREMLRKAGHRFYTNGDTEVIAHLYEEKGPGFASEINGIFAIAIWDSKKRRLVLARDPIGIKPLYYAIHNGIILFASEAKAILLWEGLKLRLDEQALHFLFNLFYIPGEMTMFQGVKKLLPGHILVVDEGGSTSVEKYWRLPTNIIEGSEDALAKMLRKMLENSISRQMISDVPIGSFLSGGLDTSIIVALMAKGSNEPIRTFTMGFGEKTDELLDAKFVSECFSTEHHEIMISPKEIKMYPKAIWHADMPKINLYPYFLSEFTRKHVKVALSGMGGDELFGGYVHRFGYIRRIESLERLGATGSYALKTMGRIGLKIAGKSLKLHRLSNRLQVLSSIGDRSSQYSIVAGAFCDGELKRIYGDKMKMQTFGEIKDTFKEYFHEDSGFIDQAMRAEFNTKLPDDLLLIDDAMTMAHALEERVPLLDLELVNLAFRMSTDLKYMGSQGKYILRLAVKDLLPKRVLQKPKWGFSVDVFSWFTGEMGEIAQQVLPTGYLVKGGYLNKDLLGQILRTKLDRSLNRYYNLIWLGLLFELWRKIYFESQDISKPILDIEKLIA